MRAPVRQFCLFAALIVPVIAPAAHGQNPIPEPLPRPGAVGRQDTVVTRQARERLHLPDVLILGKANVRQVPRTKWLPAARLPLKAETPSRSPRLSWSPAVPEDRAVPGETAAPQNSLIAVSVRFGTFKTASVGVRFWQKTGALDFRLGSGYETSNGPYRNDEYERWRVGIASSYELSKQLILSAGMQFASNRYGLWGTPVQLRRKLELLQGQIGLAGALAGKLRYAVDLKSYRLPLGSDMDRMPGHRIPAITQEKGLSASGKLKITAGAWQIGGGADFLSAEETTPPPMDVPASSTTKKTFALTAVHFVAERPLSSQGFLRVGATWQQAVLPARKKQRVFPNFALNFNLSTRTQFRLGYTGELRLLTLNRLSQINPFVDFRMPENPLEERRQKISAAVAYRLTSQIFVTVSYDYTTASDLFYWSRLDTAASEREGLFTARSVERGHLGFLAAEIHLGNLDPLRLRIRTQISTSGIDKYSAVSVPPIIRDVPYLEDLAVPVEAEYRISRNITARAEFHYFGSRFVNLEFPKQLGSIWLLNARLSYRMKPFEFFLTGRNLLNQKFEIWEGYPVPTAQLLAGVNARF